MKKTLLYLFLTVFSAGSLWAQCVSTCSVYNVSPITYTTFPSAGINPISTFTPNQDDGITPSIPLGFNFDFYCNTYNSVWICTNGFIQFGNVLPAISTGYADPTQSFPSSTNPNNMIALYMCDLDPSTASGAGTITYTTVGTSPNQKFVVTFSNVPIFGYLSNLINGQIVLHETSNIIDIYTTSVLNQSTTNGTQGIEDATGLLGLPSAPAYNNSIWSRSTSMAYRFAPYTPAPPSSVTGNTMLCEGDQANYQASFITSATGYVWTLPSGWSGTSTISALSAYAGSAGNVSVSATYTCGMSAPAVINVSVNPAPLVAINSLTPPVICSGQTVTLTTSGALTYTINPGSIPSAVSTITDMPLSTTIYTLTGTSSNGCVSVNDPTVKIIVNETPVISVNSGTICVGQTFTVTPFGAANFVISGLPFGTTSPTLAGQYGYSVTGTGTNGCVSLPVVSSLTVYALPSIGASASRTLMCLKESVSLTASGANSYSWTGSTSNASVITVSPITTTVYMVTGASAHGCINSQTVSVKVIPCTGIDEFTDTYGQAQVFPNPTNESFEIRLDAINDKTVIELYDGLGRLLITEKVTSLTTGINLAQYNNGLYYVKVKHSSEEKPQVIKVIKQ